MRWIVLALGLVVAACAGVETPAPTPQQPEWRLVAAPQAADTRHLIVTVPLDRPEVLAAVAEALSRDYPVELVAEWPLASIDVHCLVFRLAAPAPTEPTLAALAADPRVRTVQPMQRFETLAVSIERDLVPIQDGLRALDVLAAHRVATGQGVRVGVIDTRPDATHPELAASLSDVRDFVGESPVAGGEEHGTAVVGIIGAEATAGRGMVGVAPDAEILGLRACWEATPGARGQCSSFSLARALNFALLQEIDVLNLSLSGPPDPLLEELIAAAVARDVVVVAARGANEGAGFPASARGVVAVAAVADAGATVLAPGQDVLSTAPGGEYDFYSGSSMAAAHVSGIAALLLDLRPGLDGATARQVLAGSNGLSAAPPRLVTACEALLALDATRARTACETRQVLR
ncbi:MAG: S8 family serine peptidase [Pseudomonadota bacterium]